MFREVTWSMLAVVLLATPASAQRVPLLPQDSILRSLDARIEGAVVHGDLAALDTLYAEDLNFAHFTGTVDGKTAWLRQAQARAFKQRSVDSVTVDRHGDVALTSGRLAVEAAQGARYVLRFVRLYVRRQGRWQLVAHRSVGVEQRPSGKP